MTTTQSTASPQTSDPIAEIRSTRETAEKIAKEGATDGADVARVLAGLIAHLAQQMELLASGSPAIGTTDGHAHDREEPVAQIVDATEEDISPDDAPAHPGSGPERGVELPT